MDFWDMTPEEKEAIKQIWLDMVWTDFTLEEILSGYKPEEVLAGFSPEELLR